MKQFKFWFVLLLVLIFSLAIFIIWRAANSYPSKQVAIVSDQSDQGMPSIGGKFELIDHLGNKRTDKDFRGKFMMVYFGYRFCPDICPTALSTMTEVLEILGAKAKHIQPIFITIDPERDKIEELAEYMQNFHSSFLGLTGTKDEIEKVRKAYRVFAVKAQENGDSADYLIDHSSIIYIMDRQGKLISHFNHSTQPEHIVTALRKVL